METYKTKRIIDGKPPLRTVIVDESGKVVNKNPTKDELKDLKKEPRQYRDTIKKPIYYNETNTCPKIKDDGTICGNKLIPKRTYREHDKYGRETGRWLCANCFSKYDPNSRSNIIRLLQDRRTNNLKDPNNIFGDNTLELACILYGWEDLNKKYDNYNAPIDCYDPKTGLYHQVQGKKLIVSCDRNENWPFSRFEKDWEKEYKSMICFCFSEDRKIVERIYKIPFEEEIKDKRKSLSIYKNLVYNGCGWYEQYIVTDEEELKKANEIWQKRISRKLR